MLASHLAVRRNLKLLASGNLGRQQTAENTMRRMEIGLQKAIVTAKNDFIAECAAAYRSHKERDFHTELITHRLAVKLLLQQQAQKVIPTFGQATLRDIRASVKSRQRPIERKAAGDDSLFNRLIQQWLGQRKEMASNIAQTTLNDVLGAVQSGIDDGDGTEEIARSIDDVTRLSLPRSRVIARTETHAAASFAQIESARAAQSDLGISLVKTWLPTLDNRTREDHAEMADYGAIPLDEEFIVGGYEMDRPGDPNGGPEEVINCLHPDSIIDAASPLRLMRRWFDGKLVTIETAGGNKLTVTPNHPILTMTGWKTADLLEEGDCVVSASRLKSAAAIDLNVQHVKTSIEQIFNTLSIPRMRVRMAGIRVDFHGERGQQDVDIIDGFGDLLSGRDFLVSDPLCEFVLPSADLGAGAELANSLLFRQLTKKSRRRIAQRRIGLRSQLLPILKAGLRHALTHRFGPVALCYPKITQAEVDRIPGSSQGRCHSLNAIVGIVEPFNFGQQVYSPSAAPKEQPGTMPGFFLDRVLAVHRHKYSGFVYNLEDQKSYYICNGIVQHNCRCTLVMGPAS